MYTNINAKHLLALYEREPEAQLAIVTMIENHKRIIGTIGHEIGNPLTYLNSSAQLLEESHISLKSDKHWVAIRDEIVFMTELLSQLSAFNNGSTLRMEETNIHDLLASVVLTLASSSTEDHVEISSSIPHLPLVTIDRNKIRQVIINLLKNAKEACTSQGQVLLSAHHESDHIVISIKDNGCGIPDALLPDIFTPFKTFKSGGTGLGLAITHEIITAHEGSIKVYSREGKGSEFVITLPIE